MPQSSAPPKVSCLLVTADRHALCRRAVHSYQQQTYPNTELVVLDNGAEPMRNLLGDLPENEIRYAHEAPSPNRSLGALRNTALEMAGGEFIAPQWDDDDWSHPDRIARQVSVLQEGFDACSLQGTLMHVDSHEHFNKPFIGLLPNGVPPTILHRREASIRYPEQNREEDTVYVNRWRTKKYKILPRSESYLYLRYYHGDNTWEQNHFLRRVRNTPKDLMLYVWHKYLRGNEFGHPRYQLTAAMQAGFERYLRDSASLGLFEEDRVQQAINSLRTPK